MYTDDTIVALSTPPGVSAIGVVRLSGKGIYQILSGVLKTSSGKSIDLSEKATHSSTYCFFHETDGRLLDEVIVTLFKGKKSFTAEDLAEISFHGSPYILQRALSSLIENGARPANPGEFSYRAFLNGRIDLSRAEAVGDLIASQSRASHENAMKQLRGSFSGEIKNLRSSLIEFASLIELELDFSEEDVEFANRDHLQSLVDNIYQKIRTLEMSFEFGNAIKKGIPVAIVGKPNAGKSTLLNTLIGEERAIVSAIPGTTRDTLEDVLIIDGVEFRFIDTAGLRETQDEIESIGVERAYAKINSAEIIIYVFDSAITSRDALNQELSKIPKEKFIILAGNKADKTDLNKNLVESLEEEIILISARDNYNIDTLKQRLLDFYKEKLSEFPDTIVTNARHASALKKAALSLHKVQQGLKTNITGDLLAADLRAALFHLGEITGEISSEDLLDSIFSKFCIGK